MIPPILRTRLETGWSILTRSSRFGLDLLSRDPSLDSQRH